MGNGKRIGHGGEVLREFSLATGRIDFRQSTVMGDFEFIYFI